MDEYASPVLVEPASSGNLTDIIVDNAAEVPATAILSRRVSGQWHNVTTRQFLDEVSGVARGLMAQGVGPGDRVALMSRTRYEWTLLDFAIWMAGAVTVPIYETSSAEQVRWILDDSGAVAVIVESAEHESMTEEIRRDLPAVTSSWTIEKGAVDQLTTAGSSISETALEERRRLATPDDLATIIYTSGTTGRPKGCALTHSNLLFECANVTSAKDPDANLSAVFQDQDASTLLFLPLAHVFARVIQVAVIMARGRMGHTADIKNLTGDLASFQPTFLLAVPRVFEKIYNNAAQKAEKAGKSKIFNRAADTAIAYSRSLDAGGASLGLRLKHGLYDKLVYAKMRAALGGKIRWAISGGAPLGDRLGHFFRGIGFTVLEGYGLTETTAASTVNTPALIKIGTVGRPLPGMGLRIAEDGEILIRGAHVFRGYYNNDEATAEALTDGEFHSGDIGELDADGFLRITGRKKELIVTAGGKNVAPAGLEDRLRAHRLVSQCVVVGDAQPFIACLVTLDEEALAHWRTHQSKGPLTLAAAAEDADVIAEIQHAVDDANKSVSKAEAIKKFKILSVDFTVENGALTPSIKLKRNVVMKDYAAEIDALYS